MVYGRSFRVRWSLSESEEVEALVDVNYSRLVVVGAEPRSGTTTDTVWELEVSATEFSSSSFSEHALNHTHKKGKQGRSMPCRPPTIGDHSLRCHLGEQFLRSVGSSRFRSLGFAVSCSRDRVAGMSA